MAVLMAYCAIAAIFEVKLQFAALLAGYGIVGGLYGSQRERFSAPIDAISGFLWCLRTHLLLNHRL
jgi:hypothetical protein